MSTVDKQDLLDWVNEIYKRDLSKTCEPIRSSGNKLIYTISVFLFI